jgi:pimeloyl-ACP methyl ester carboxylesterase
MTPHHTPPAADDPDLAWQQIDVGALTFDAIVSGPQDGRTVLLLHGFPQTAWSWRHVIRALTGAGLRVVAVDQRGYSPGASPDAVTEYAGEHLVADVLGVLDALGLESVDLVGHDWGAAVAWEVASLHPDRVATLTAVSVPHPGAFAEALRGDQDQQSRSAYMRDFRRPGFERVLLADDAAVLRSVFGAHTGVDVEHVVARLGRPDVLRRALSWYAAQSTDRARTIPATSVPTLHIWSDDDRYLGEYATRATQRFVTGPYELHVLRGISHWVPENAPDETADLILRHLQRFPGARAVATERTDLPPSDTRG